jgi:hypothetical protein
MKRNKLTIILLPFLQMSFFITCATTSVNNRPYAYLTNSSKFFLLSGGCEKPMDMAQFLSAFYGSQDIQFTAWVKADETTLEIIMLNDMGISMGELSYMNSVVSFSSSVLPSSVKPEYIIADFQLCFHDTGLLNRALAGCGLVLEADETNRRILQGKKIIIEIEKDADKVIYKNYLRGYSYTLEGNFT